MTLDNEEILLVSDDKKITLTNQCVIYKTPQSSKEIDLRSITGYDLKYKREGIIFFFGLIVLIGGIFLFTDKTMEVFIVTLCVMLAYFLISTKMLTIQGKTFNLEIPVNGFSQTGLQTFIDTMLEESDKQKRGS